MVTTVCETFTPNWAPPTIGAFALALGTPASNEVAAFVLRKPPQSERELIYKCIDQAKAALPAFLDGDLNKATTLVHAQPQRPKPPRKPAPQR